MRGLLGNVRSPNEEIKYLTLFLLIKNAMGQNSTDAPIEIQRFGDCGITCFAVIIFLAAAAIAFLTEKLCCKSQNRRRTAITEELRPLFP